MRLPRRPVLNSEPNRTQSPVGVHDSCHPDAPAGECVLGIVHDWMLRPESDTFECLACGDER